MSACAAAGPAELSRKEESEVGQRAAGVRSPARAGAGGCFRSLTTRIFVTELASACLEECKEATDQRQKAKVLTRCVV